MTPRASEEERREEIIKAAQKLILKNGYGHTTLGQVAVRAGVSKGLISYYFPKKDDLFLAVLESVVDRLRRDLESCCREDLPAWERVKLNLKNLFGSERRTRSYYTVLIDFLAEAPRERSVRDYTRVIYQTHLSYMERTVEDGIARGEFRRMDAHAAASMLIAAMEGLILQWLYNPERLSLNEAYRICEEYAAEFLLAPGAACSLPEKPGAPIPARSTGRR